MPALIEDKRRQSLRNNAALGGVDEGCQGFGCGTVFKVAPDGTETILYAFTGANQKRVTDDGALPQGGLIADGSNLYGTTTSGGDTKCGGVISAAAPCSGSGQPALKRCRRVCGSEQWRHSFWRSPP